MFRKNDKITVNLEEFIKDKNIPFNTRANPHLKGLEIWRKQDLVNPDSIFGQIVTHIKNGHVGTVTGVRDDGNYLNTKFDDGFEFGIPSKFAIKVKKKDKKNL